MINTRDIKYIIISMFFWGIVIGSYYISSNLCVLFLICMMVWSFFYLKKNSLVFGIKVLFAMFYMGSLCLSVMKLVGIYQVTWSLSTWLLFFLFFEFFYLGYFVSISKKENIVSKLRKYVIMQGKRINILYTFFVMFSFLALFGFLYCVSISGYIPLFSKDVYSYIEFGNGSDLAIFYQITVILPAIGLYLLKRRKRNQFFIGLLVCLDVIICVCVKSRDFFVGMIIVTACMFYYEYALMKNGKLKRKSKAMMLFAVIIVGVFFLWISAQRGYSDSYIRRVYKAEDSPLPDSLVAPYVYITSGFYNFDILVKKLDFHTFGLMTASPILILFHIMPLRELSSQYMEMLKQYYIIPELNLFSSLGVPYIDGGCLGIILTGLLSGYIYSILEINYRKYKDAFSLILYAIGIHHVVMCFFTSWISSFQYFIYAILMVAGVMLTQNQEKIR